MRKVLTAVVLAGSLALMIPGVAMAQEPAPPVANCDPFSSIVCQVPVTVNIGPIPVEIGSVFSPAPVTP